MSRNKKIQQSRPAARETKQPVEPFGTLQIFCGPKIVGGTILVTGKNQPQPFCAANILRTEPALLRIKSPRNFRGVIAQVKSQAGFLSWSRKACWLDFLRFNPLSDGEIWSLAVPGICGETNSLNKHRKYFYCLLLRLTQKIRREHHVKTGL